VSLGFFFIPVSVIALGDLSDAQRGNGTGLFNLTRELGGSIGTAWMGLVVDRGSTIHGSYLREAVNATNPIVQEQMGALAGGPGALTHTRELLPESILDLKVRSQALVMSFNDGFLYATIVFLFALVLVLMLRKAKPGAAPVAAH
jgi:DHA2 family multidrug resistance protein